MHYVLGVDNYLSLPKLPWQQDSVRTNGHVEDIVAAFALY